jgi:D-alanyl-D-alanine endopeptidase (penicillin-binding protein 7)
MSTHTPDLVFTVGWTLVHFLWQGALIGFATAVALTLLRNARPHARYLAACTGLFTCVAWPAAELWLQLADSGTEARALDAPARMVMAGAVQAAPNLLAWLQEHMQLLVGAWASCALALALRMVLGLAWLGRAGRTSCVDARWQASIDRLAELAGITRSVRLRIVEGLASPVTAGWWRPVVLVPAALVSRMPPDLLEALLAHEIAHVKRHDYLVNLVQNLVETLLFYHPAVWWISGRIRTEREQIADDFAARQVGEPRRLAQALSELEKLQFSANRLALAANGGELFVRIKRLVRPDTQALSWKAALPVLGLAIACLSASSHMGHNSEPQHSSPQPEARATKAPEPPVNPPAPSSVARVAQPAHARLAPASRSEATLAKDAAAPKPVPESAPGQAAESADRDHPIVTFTSCDKPQWPRADLQAGHEGTVTLAFLVGEDGTARDSRIVRSSGYRNMDEQARLAIEKCAFLPAIVEGKPVQSWATMQYVWTQH